MAADRGRDFDMGNDEIVYEYDRGSASRAAHGCAGDYDGEAESGAEMIGEIGPEDAEYPESLRTILGNSAPELLTCTGEAGLLAEPCVMVCGARDASETALDLAYRCGRIIAGSGIVLASGYARGVDMAAHRGALESGGNTLAFLPYGLMRFRVHRALKDSFDAERFLAVSELRPWQVFTAYAALRRNTLLAALSRVVIVVEPGESGGSWYSAERAHRMGKPLYFLEGTRPRIAERMESLGGVRIRVRKGTPDLTGILTS